MRLIPQHVSPTIVCLSNERTYDEMRRNALEAAKIFNWENESRKLLATYERLGLTSNG